MISKFTLTPIAAALLMATAVNVPVMADTGIKEETTVAAGRQITPQDEATISSAAVKVLRHIAEARGNLQGDQPDTDKAKAELDKSEKLLDIIQAALPTTKVKDRIWVAKKHLEYEDSREVLPDLVPIYASLDELVDYMPTGKAKAHLDQARQAMKEGDKTAARDQLQATDDALLYVEADLPLNTTRQLVAQAQADLTKADAKQADQALASAEDNVVFISVSFQSPLTHAKAALWRAREDYGLGEKDYAKADLDEAVKYLQQAAKGGDDVTRQATEALIAEVRELNGMVASDDAGFSNKIESAWNRVKALTERSAEYISTGWQRLRAEGKGKTELIEAKLRLDYARIDHFVSKDEAAARVDLADTRGYLDAAAKRVAPEIRPQVEKVADLVDGLDKVLREDTPAPDNGAAFEAAESQLAVLIRQI